MNHRTAQKKSADCFNNRRFPASVVKTPPSSHYIAPIPLGRNRIYIYSTLVLAVLHQCVWGEDSSLNPIRIESISENLGWLLAGYAMSIYCPSTRQSSCTRRTTYYYFVPLSSCLHCHKSRCDDDTKTYLPLGIFQDEIYSRDHQVLYDKIFFSAYCVRDNFSVFIKSL